MLQLQQFPLLGTFALTFTTTSKFSPRFCFWAVERKLAETHENLIPGTFAEYVFNELKDYVESRSELQDNFYKHLVINAQTRTFADPNSVSTIGSKVVIRPLAETLELSIKKDQQLQRTMVHMDLTSASETTEEPHQVRCQWQMILYLGTHHLVRCQWQMLQQKFLNTYHQVRNQERKYRKKKMWRWKHLKNNMKKNLHKRIL